MMNQRNIFPIYLATGSNFERNEQQYDKYINKYERSHDESLQYVTAIIRNKDDAILVGFNKKHKSRQIPSGKIDKGESHHLALKREMEEEISFEVKETTYIGTSKVLLNGMSRQGHFYDTKVSGELVAKELDTVETFKWMNYIETDTRLGFGLTDGQETITDPLEILKNWHMFSELYWMSNFPSFQGLVKQKISTPDNRETEELYIQYRDVSENSFVTKKHEEFLANLEK